MFIKILISSNPIVTNGPFSQSESGHSKVTQQQQNEETPIRKTLANDDLQALPTSRIVSLKKLHLMCALSVS